MPARFRILVALLGCLAFGGDAVAADLSHCDAICCDTPCDTAPLTPDACPCCVVRGAVGTDPMVPVPPLAAPTPAVALTPADLAIAPTAAALTGEVPVSRAAPPAPPRPTVLRL